eukprot:473173-Rhodomonas_salina.2
MHVKMRDLEHRASERERVRGSARREGPVHTRACGGGKCAVAKSSTCCEAGAGPRSRGGRGSRAALAQGCSLPRAASALRSRASAGPEARAKP